MRAALPVIVSTACDQRLQISSNSIGGLGGLGISDYFLYYQWLLEKFIPFNGAESAALKDRFT